MTGEHSQPAAPTSDQTSMDPETLEALKGSIAKWEGIVSGTMHDEGADNCALCQRFHACFRTIPGECCQGCPVNAVSGRGCDNTPYAHWGMMEIDRVSTDEHRDAAQAELDFLKSLLPKETP